ncbi:hypothetical protein BC834DRAFT_863823 [Gloeopeniophorella convolvens]|nr:hypothetical protein BC834DRAFT_863823 [Gloeopeniophorella convolvens]
MPSKSGSISERPSKFKTRSKSKPSKSGRLPLADITNTYSHRTDLREEHPATPRARTPGILAMQHHNIPKLPGASKPRGSFARAAALISNPPMAHHLVLPAFSPCPDVPSLLEDSGSSVESGPLSEIEPPMCSISVLRNQRNDDALGFSAATSTTSAHPRLSSTTKALPLSSLSKSPTPDPLSTSLLTPRTHKVSYGQVVILPSRSVLIDFREGERRKGSKGDEVLVVSANGDQIHIYSAPHLSTPCCLAEPIATYTLTGLPEDQSNLYEQAKKVIERIKRNIPKLIMYEDAFVCTLMANEPRADLEIRAKPLPVGASVSARGTAAIRIRFSRKLRTMEITSDAPRMSKKTMFCTARGVPTDAEDWASLSNQEKECLAALLDFLRSVEIIEGSPRSALEPSDRSAKPPKGAEERPAEQGASWRRESGLQFPQTNQLNPSDSALPSSAIAEPPSARSINVTVGPRPRLSRSFPRSMSDTLRKASSTAVGITSVHGDSPSLPDTRPQSAASLAAPPALRLQTRFLPDIGWCVRTGDARYRIMFVDGVALEVDVDEEQIEVTERDGSNTRYAVRDCHASRKVGERMKAFQEFVSLFDDSEY